MTSEFEELKRRAHLLVSWALHPDTANVDGYMRTKIEDVRDALIALDKVRAISDIHARLESALAESQRRADLIDQLAAMVKETKQERDEANRRRVAVTDSGMAALTEAGERIAAVERERDEALEQAAYWQRTANEFEQESIRDLAQRDRRIDDLQRLVAWCHARLDQEHVAYVERKLSALSAPAQSKEHCPRRLMGETLAPHAPCDTGDHSRDAQPATAAKEHRPHCSYFYKDPANPDNCDCAAPPSPAARVKNADKAVCPHCGFDGPCELHDHLDAVISSNRDDTERSRILELEKALRQVRRYCRKVIDERYIHIIDAVLSPALEPPNRVDEVCNFRWDTTDGHHYCGEDPATKHRHVCACCNEFAT